MMELKTIYGVIRVDYENDEKTGELKKVKKLYSVHTKRSAAVKQLRHRARCEDTCNDNRIIQENGFITFTNKETGSIVKEYILVEDQIRV